MACVVTVSNRKGGVSKTTTALGLAGGLAARGRRVLCVDLDGQENMTYIMGADTEERPTVYDVLMNGVPAADAVQRTEQGDILPSSSHLELIDMELSNKDGTALLRRALEPIRSEYDYIIVDTPPALGLSVITALSASDGVVIPLQADILSLNGLDQMGKIIDEIRRQGNTQLRIYGLLLTKFTPRTILNRAISDAFKDAASNLNTIVFETYIREGIAVREAQAQRRGIFSVKSNPAADFMAWTDEFIRTVEGDMPR